MRTVTTILVTLSLLTGATVGVFAQTEDEAQPDLVPTALDAASSDPVEGDNVTFTANITNDGDADAGPFNVTFLVDADPIGENKTVGALDAGNHTLVTSDNWTSTAGDHDVSVVVDAHDDVSESNETNNQLNDTIGVAADETDLAVTELAADPSQPMEGDDVSLSATVENQGNVTSNESSLRFFVNGTALGGDVTVPALAPGENATVDSANWSAVEGDHTIRALADPDDNVTESNETNNDQRGKLTVAPDEADLLVDDITHDPAAPEPGDNTTFTATIANDGHSDAENVTVQFQIDGDVLSNATIASLAANDTAEVTSDAWNATDGEHTVRVIADLDDNVTESDEDNNEANETFQVAEQLPDLEPTGLDAPANATEGDEITFNATVANTGDETAENVTVSFLVDGELVSNETIETLNPGDDTNVTSDAWNATEGNHTATVDVDPDDAVSESDEADNDRSEDFSVAEAEEDDGDEGDEAEEGEETITICHIPPGNPDARHTKEIGKPAWDAHEDHGDHKGACEDEAESDHAEDDASEDEDDEPQAEGNGRGNGNGRGPP